MPLLTGPEALKQDNGLIVVNKYWFDRRRAKQKKTEYLFCDIA